MTLFVSNTPLFQCTRSSGGSTVGTVWKQIKTHAAASRIVIQRCSTSLCSSIIIKTNCSAADCILTATVSLSSNSLMPKQCFCKQTQTLYQRNIAPHGSLPLSSNHAAAAVLFAPDDHHQICQKHVLFAPGDWQQTCRHRPKSCSRIVQSYPMQNQTFCRAFLCKTIKTHAH